MHSELLQKYTNKEECRMAQKSSKRKNVGKRSSSYAPAFPCRAAARSPAQGHSGLGLAPLQLHSMPLRCHHCCN